MTSGSPLASESTATNPTACGIDQYIADGECQGLFSADHSSNRYRAFDGCQVLLKEAPPGDEEAEVRVAAVGGAEDLLQEWYVLALIHGS